MDCDERYVKDLAADEQTWNICGKTGRCIRLNAEWFSDYPYVECDLLPSRAEDDDDLDEYGNVKDELVGEEPEPFYGCLTCLSEGRFNFVHETAAGFITRDTIPNLGIKKEIIDGLTRTPHYRTRLGNHYRWHCGD